MKITIDQIPQNVSIKSIVIDLDIDTSDVKVLYQENKSIPINNTNQSTANQNIQERKEIPVPPEMNMQF